MKTTNSTLATLDLNVINEKIAAAKAQIAELQQMKYDAMCKAYFALYKKAPQLFKKYSVYIDDDEICFILGCGYSMRTVDAMEKRRESLGIPERIVSYCGDGPRGIEPGSYEWRDLYNEYAE